VRKLIWLATFLTVSLAYKSAVAQNSALTGYCTQGATAALVSGLKSTNQLQGVIPKCTVTVFQTGTSTKATIYSNSTRTPLANPFTANATSGQWLFYAATACYDVVLSGGTPPNSFQSPVTLTGICPVSLPIPGSVDAGIYAGADCGAKINAANSFWSGIPVTINFSQSCGTTWTTPISLAVGHSLNCAQGGTYTIPGGNLLRGNNAVTQTGNSCTLKMQSGDTHQAMFATSDGSSFAGSHIFISIGFDGNGSNQTQETFPTTLIFVGDDGNGNVSNDVTVAYSTIAHCKSSCITQFINTNANSYGSGLTIVGNTISDSGNNAITAIGLNNFTAENNTISAWGTEYPSDCITGGLQALTGGADKIAHNWKIVGNKCIGGTSQKFSVELFSSSSTLYFDGLDMSGNWFIGNTDGTCYNGFSGGVRHANIDRNRWLQPVGMAVTSACVAGGIPEGSNLLGTITNNVIDGGTIAVGSSGSGLNSGLTVIANNQLHVGPLNNVRAMSAGGATTGETSNNFDIHDNDINVTGVTGSSVAFITGIFEGPNPSTASYIQFHNNTIHDDANSHIVSGVLLAGLDGSTTVEVDDNVMIGLAYALDNSPRPTIGTTDLSFQRNVIRNTSALYGPDGNGVSNGAVVRIWENSQSGSDTKQFLNGIADVTNTGVGEFLGTTIGGLPITQAATAPTGSCSTIGYVLSNDGHMTYCNGTTYSLKF
jgi:hypothetical protein